MPVAALILERCDESRRGWEWNLLNQRVNGSMLTLTGHAEIPRTAPDQSWVYDVACSPDGRWIALDKIDTRDNSNVFLYDVEAKSTRLLTKHDGDINYSSAEFSTDGKHLLMTTDSGSEFLYLIKYELSSGKIETVFQTDWDVLGAGYSKHGKYLGIVINQDARIEYDLYLSDGMKRVDVPVIEGASLNQELSQQDHSRG